MLEKANLVVANKVLDHVPGINDFAAGIVRLLKTQGRATIEQPHLLRLLDDNQFDRIYHEHYSYLSLRSVQSIAAAPGLEEVDVDSLPTQSGSLRVRLAHGGTAESTAAVASVLVDEAAMGLESITAYDIFNVGLRLLKTDC